MDPNKNDQEVIGSSDKEQQTVVAEKPTSSSETDKSIRDAVENQANENDEKPSSVENNSEKCEEPLQPQSAVPTTETSEATPTSSKESTSVESHPSDIEKTADNSSEKKDNFSGTTASKRTASDALFGTTSEFEREKKIQSTVFSNTNTFSTFASSTNTSLFSKAANLAEGSSIFAKSTGPIFGGSTASNAASDTTQNPLGSKETPEGNEGVFAKQTTSIFGAPASTDDKSVNDTKAALLPPVPAPSTGEEDEENLHQVRGKLFRFRKATGDEPPEWKEIGAGQFKVNRLKKPEAGKQSLKSRMVMRQSGVFKLLLNARIFPGMVVEKVQDKMIRFACDSRVDTTGSELASNNSGFETFLLRLGRNDARNEVFTLLKELSATLEQEETATESATGSTSDKDKE